MGRTERAGRTAEARMLGALALVCYAATLAAMFAFGYLLLTFALRALGADLALLLSPAGV